MAEKSEAEVASPSMSLLEQFDFSVAGVHLLDGPRPNYDYYDKAEWHTRGINQGLKIARYILTEILAQPVAAEVERLRSSVAAKEEPSDFEALLEHHRATERENERLKCIVKSYESRSPDDDGQRSEKACSPEPTIPPTCHDNREAGLEPADSHSTEQWRPIGTAPKDGTSILVWDEGICIVTMWVETDQGAGFWDAALIEPPPQYWMPLPAEPAAEGALSAPAPPAGTRALIHRWRDEASRYREIAIHSSHLGAVEAPAYERGIARGRGLCATELEASSCAVCGNPIHERSCPSPPGKHAAVSLRAAPPALEELIEAWRAKRNLTDRPRWTVYERCADELETALADVARLQTPHEERCICGNPMSGSTPMCAECLSEKKSRLAPASPKDAQP